MFASCGGTEQKSKAEENKDSSALIVEDTTLVPAEEVQTEKSYIWKKYPEWKQGDELEVIALDKITLAAGTDFGDTLFPYLALHQLFPGKFSIEPSDYSDQEFPLVRWKCDNCKREDIIYEYLNENYGVFPDSNVNTTVVSDLIEMDENHQALVFNHYSQYSIDFSGRFLGPGTGIAIFKRVKGRWKLETFDPYVGCYGSFNNLFAPSLLRVGKEKWLFDFSYSNGGAGGMYTTVSSLYVPAGMEMRRVLRRDDLFMYNTEYGEWATEIQVPDSLGVGWSDLVLITTGTMNGVALSDGSEEVKWLLGWICKEWKSVMEECIQSKKEIRFRSEIRMTYKGEYKEVSTKMEVLKD